MITRQNLRQCLRCRRGGSNSEAGTRRRASKAIEGRMGSGDTAIFICTFSKTARRSMIGTALLDLRVRCPPEAVIPRRLFEKCCPWRCRSDARGMRLVERVCTDANG